MVRKRLHSISFRLKSEVHITFKVVINFTDNNNATYKQ